MNIIWRFISSIYCSLIISGFKITIPNFLFNNPKQKLPQTYHENILADKTFTEEEKILIMSGLKDLEKFLNGFITFNILFTLDPNDDQTINDNCIMLRTAPDHPSIVSFDQKYGVEILGLCSYMDNSTKRIYLVSDRIKSPIQFKTTFIHELGHFVGLNHTEMPSIMHKSIFGNIIYPTYKDAVEAANVFNRSPKNFKYLKL